MIEKEEADRKLTESVTRNEGLSGGPVVEVRVVEGVEESRSCPMLGASDEVLHPSLGTLHHDSCNSQEHADPDHRIAPSSSCIVSSPGYSHLSLLKDPDLLFPQTQISS